MNRLPVPRDLEDITPHWLTQTFASHEASKPATVTSYSAHQAAKRLQFRFWEPASMHRAPHDIFRFPIPLLDATLNSEAGVGASSSMMQKYVRTAQPDFVMPPCLIHPGAGSHILKPPTVDANLPKILGPWHDEIRQPTLTRANCPRATHSSATAQLRPCY